MLSDDFQVDEISLYAPSGEGQHVYLHVEKTGHTTEDVVRWLRRLGLREIGYAGRKDRQAITRQWFSVERRRWTDAFASQAPPGIRILAAIPHGNKLKLGHLRGNRFRIRIRACGATHEELDEALALLRQQGMPNYFGEQRFGRVGSNAELGRAVLAGRARGMPKTKARFLLSALQSEIFNAYLAERICNGTWRRVLSGDVLKKTATGGLFRTSEPTTDQARLEAGEIVPAGPLFGPHMPEADDEARALEERVLSAAGFTRDDWCRSAVPTSGSRRALFVYPDALMLEREDDSTLILSFGLPKGSYATALLREIQGEHPAR